MSPTIGPLTLLLVVLQGELRAHLDTHRAIAKDQRTTTACLVNTFGVVLGFGCPSRTRRGEWMVTAALVDASLPINNNDLANAPNDSLKTVNVNIFSKERSNLPKIRFAGDVLRLHRVSKCLYIVC